MNPAKAALNRTYAQFHQLTDHLLTVIHTPTGATQEKISEIAKSWADFLQNNRSSIFVSLSQDENRDATLQKVAEIETSFKAFPQLQEAFDLFQKKDHPFPIDLLPPDVWGVVMSFLNMQELMQLSWISKKFRGRVLDIQSWRSNRMFQRLLQSGIKEGMQPRQQFARVLGAYQQQAIGPSLAAEFLLKARHDSWSNYLAEIDRDERDVLYKLLKNQDLSSLQFLYLPGDNWLDKDNLNFEFFLKKCPNLTGLYVGWGQTFITDSVLTGIAERYPGLLYFNCELSSVVTGSYLHSWPVTKIETLVLGGSPQFQAGYFSANVAKFPELKKLLLFNLRLTDEDVKSLVKLTKLEDLNLSANPNLTDATLAILEKLPSLKSVNLKGVKNITSAGLRALRTARPDLSLTYD